MEQETVYHSLRIRCALLVSQRAVIQCLTNGSLDMYILSPPRDLPLNFQRSILLIQIQDNELATLYAARIKYGLSH